MNQKHYFYSNPKRMLSCFLNELATRQIQHTKRHIKDIIGQKKAKIKSMYVSSSHEVIQPSIVPTKKDYSEFMTITPGAVGQEFISEKIKANVLTPQRFYSREPNIKAGSSFPPKKWSLPDDKVIINQQFKEYDRVVDDQSGIVKKARLAKLMQNYEIDPRKTKKRSYRMKKTYFQKFAADKYNFYKPPSQHAIALQSTSVLKKSRSKGIQTMDTRPNALDSRRQYVSLATKEHKKTQFIDVRSARSREKRNETTSIKSRVKTIVHQKNMDSAY